MSDVLTYKGYSAKIEFDAADRIFFGRIAGIQDGVGFHADTVDDLIDAFHEAVDDYRETCERIGKEPEKAYSGKLMFRVDPALHAKLAVAAELAGQSLNQFGEAALADAVMATTVIAKWNSAAEMFELPKELALTEEAELLGASYLDSGTLAEMVRAASARPEFERKRLVMKLGGRIMYWREVEHLRRRPDFPAI